MGFDIHGINPVMREISEDKYPTYHKYHKLNWGDRIELFRADSKQEEKYNEEWNLREEENCGIYFRNNCWWWRPLWNYVCGSCEDILDEDDVEGGSWNDGYKISEEKASAIAKRLFELINTGDTKGYEDYHLKTMKEAEENNKGKKMGDDGYDWNDSYPFSVDNVRNFAQFCSESGGFEIC